MNNIVAREPVNLTEIQQEIEDVFVFRAPISQQHSESCQKIQQACKALSQLIVEEVPEGKERTIAVNNLLSVALFARHGITRRQVLIAPVMHAEDLPESEVIPSESPAPAQT